MTTWLMILGMACITFSVRYLFLARSIPVRISPSIQRLLKYSAPSVLTAMWIPIVFYPHQTLSVSLSNPYLIAACIAIILALTKISTLFVVLASMASFLLLNHFIT